MSDSDAATAEPSEPAPAKKRKKKRKSAATQDAALSARADWPAFARSFPSHPDVDELVAAFEEGNYARVRERAQKLLERTRKGAEDAPDDATRDEVRRAARELLRRIDPDPIAAYMLIAAAVLLAVLSLWYWSHPHAAP